MQHALHNKEIFAVIWCDFIPLSLHCSNDADVIQKAKDIHERAEMNGVVLRELRAVRLDENDKLHTLWKPE